LSFGHLIKEQDIAVEREEREREKISFSHKIAGYAIAKLIKSIFPRQSKIRI